MDRADKPWTSTEVERLIFSFQAMEEIPKIDNAKFGELIGASKATAGVAWSRLKAKLQHRRDNNITSVGMDTAQSSAKAPATPKKATTSAKDTYDAADEPKTPASNGRKRKAKNATPDADNKRDTAAGGNKKKKGTPAVKEEDQESDHGAHESATEMVDADGDDMDDQAFLNAQLFED